MTEAWSVAWERIKYENCHKETDNVNIKKLLLSAVFLFLAKTKRPRESVRTNMKKFGRE